MSGKPGASGYEPRTNPAERRDFFDIRRQQTDLQKGHFSRLEDPADNNQWTDLRVPLSAVRVGAAKIPGFANWRDNGAGSTGVGAFHFDSTAEEQVYFDAQLPHGYKEGSRLAPHLHYVLPVAPSAAQTLRFGLEYTYANVNGVFPNTTIIYATETFTGAETINTQYIAGFDPDIEDANVRVSAMFSCRLFRDAPNDTYANDAIVLEFDIHYQMDSLGSDGEFSK